MKNAITRGCACLSFALLTHVPLASAQSMEIFTGGARFVDVPGNQVNLQPQAIAFAPNGTLYVSDINGRLFRVNVAQGTATALPATSGGLNFNLGSPNAIAFDSSGTLHAASLGALFTVDGDTGTTMNVGSMGSASQMMFGPSGALYYLAAYENSLWAHRPDGSNIIIAGSTASGFAGDGGPAVDALLDQPSGFAIAANGDIYIADTNNHRIRKVSAQTGLISTVAGTGTYGFNGDGLPALQTNVSQPYSVTFDATGGVIFAGSDYRIRRIDATSGLVSTIAGTGIRGSSGDGGPATSAQFTWLRYLTYDANGTLYFGDYRDVTPSSHNVRKIDASTGIVSRVLGNDLIWFCGENWPIRAACLSNPRGLDVNAAGDLLIADTVNSRVRKASASTGLITTIANVSNNSVQNVEHDAAGNIYFATWGGYRIYRLDAVTGVVSIFAGNGGFSTTGDGGLATSAGIGAVTDIALDAAGNVYIADANAGRIRKIDATTRIISAYVSGFNNPSHIEFDPAGNLVVSDGLACRLRRIDKTSLAVTTIAGTGTCGVSFSGEGGPATASRLNQRQAFAFDPAGNIYYAFPSGGGGQIRRIDAVTGLVKTIPGSTGGFKTPEGVAFSDPTYLEFDAQGRLYITDTYKNLVFRITGLLDSTPPDIEPVVVGTAGQAGWYRSDVNLSWVVSDPDSGVRSQTGCTATSVATDTNGVTFTCSATSLGGTASKSVTIKRDTVAPTLTFGAVSPAADASGWNSSDVTIPFTATDARSGVYATSDSSPVTIGGSGANLHAQVTVADLAGNTATFTSPAVNIDRSAPEISHAISGSQGNDGWYTSNVQVTWTVTASGSPAAVTGCSTTAVTADTAGTTLTCTATSAGGTTSKSVTIKRDATPPTVTFDAASPAADEHGWRATPVSVPFNAIDAMSGVATTSSVSPLAITQTGEGITDQVIVTDVAGNSATFTTPAFNIDGTPPFISMQIVGTKGGNSDWYRTDVQIIWGVHDSDSQVLTHDCDNVTLTTDTVGTTYTCSGTSTGGSVTQSVTIKRDATPPTLDWSAPSPAPNAAGWFTSNVEFTFTTGDATSGVSGTSQTQPGPVVITEDGPGQTSQITVYDHAGNQAVFFTPPVNIDHLPPIVQPFVNGVMGPSVWHKEDVQLHWNVAENHILASNGCQDRLINTDTAGTTFTCSVTSGAGTTTESVTIKRDATPPVLTFGTPSPAPNANGWNKTNVSISFTRSDATSGLASTSTTSPIVLSTEGEGISGQVVVTDLAGNTATFTTVPRNIDKAAPYAEIQVPEDTATYGFYADVIAQYECVDISLVSCTGPNAIGELINTKTAGSRTFKITAKDQSLFTTTHTHSFNVASTFNFDGFLAPANDPPTLNLVARGALVPVRFRLPDGHGGFVSNTASFLSATVATLTCGSTTAVPLNDTASGPAGISFDAGTGVFTYNWQTTASWTGCRKLTIKLKDNSTHELRFKFQ